MQGRAEVARRRQQLDAVIVQIDGFDLGPELTSHFARYLAVLVAGHIEQSTKELVTQYVRKRSSVQVQRYVASQLKRVRNFDQETLRQVLQSFEPDWWATIAEQFPDELEALTSVVTLRNGVSHGNTSSSATMMTVRGHYERVNVVIDRLCDLLDPV